MKLDGKIVENVQKWMARVNEKLLAGRNTAGT
jgi:hypothetical protein